MSTPLGDDQRTLLGHPAGLFTLFFAEMWERFSFYGMRALLMLYMLKGFLKYDDNSAIAVYGAYTALVYMTPYFGGMIADRLLGCRRAVVLGGLLMAAGHLMMTVENALGFYTALALLVTGNGFFKPNISTMVGTLYDKGNPRRDAGFTIFYMGINLGAGIAPLLCGYIGEVYGWHLGFGLATIGMLTGVAIFVMPTRVTQAMILSTALATTVGLLTWRPDNVASMVFTLILAAYLLVAGAIALVALNRGGLPGWAGAPQDPQRLRTPVLGVVPAEWLVYLGALAAVPVFALLIFWNRDVILIGEEIVSSLQEGGGLKEILSVFLAEMSKPAGLILVASGVVACIYLGVATVRLPKVPRERMYVAFIMIFFALLFFAFFEQAGSSVTNFTDRNVDRVFEDRQIAAAEVGTTIRFQPTQEQLGYHNGQELFTLDVLDGLREEHANATPPNPYFEIDWVVAPDNVGMGVARRVAEVPASTFQAVNPIFILLFGVPFTALWGFLAARRSEPATPAKFALGLLQLGLGFAVFWYGARHADSQGMVAVQWLYLGYLLHTTGELCVSPVGLSMITRLSPKHLVATMMGTWFLATAFSQFLAAIIAQFTCITHGGDGGTTVPVPSATVGVYGGVFGKIAVAGIISAALCLLLSPWLKRWMHEERDVQA